MYNVNMYMPRKRASKYNTRPVADRFWEKVNKNGPIVSSVDSQCWIWTDHLTKDGYGKFYAGKGKSRYAHRTAWELANGDPGSFCVLHKCDNPACVRTDHLFLGTQTDNMRDMHDKCRGSHATGNRHPNAKLTDDDVRVIRIIYSLKLMNQPMMAKIYNVGLTVIGKCLRGETWKHVSMVARYSRKCLRFASPPFERSSS